MDFLSSTAMEEDLKDDGSDKIIEELVAACASRDLAALDVISRSTAHLQTLKQESVRLRLQSDHNEDGFTMFHLIAIAGHLPLFQFFVEQLSADLHVANETSQCNLVMMLCAHGHIDILRYIFQRNASCTTDLKQQLEAQDKDGWTALIYAVTFEVLPLVQYLIEELSVPLNQVDHIGWSALMYASQLDNDAIIDYLLQQEDTNVNQQDYDDGWTAFMHSIKSNKHKSVERLLASAKCSIDVQSWNGTSPLMICAKEGNMAMMETLMSQSEKAVDLNMQDALGNTALIFAVLQDNVAMVECLLKAGCDVNLTNQEGNTALFYASIEGNYAMVNALLQSQADTRIKNFRHISVFDVAKGADIRTLLELHRVRERIRLSLSPQKYLD